MKKVVWSFILLMALISCDSSDDPGDVIEVEPGTLTISINASHNWDGTEVTSADFETTSYTNANGESLTLNRLRYVLSNIKITKTGNESIALGHQLVDLTDTSTFVYGDTFTIEDPIETGTYTVSTTFGFEDAYNIDGAYPDLNTAVWNVPGPMGGGYHYMQMEGKYINDASEETNFQYHAIRAVDNVGTGEDLVFMDTSIEIPIGQFTIDSTTDDTTINIELSMNIAEWFKNPNQWNLNELFTVLMPNYDAQIMMNENGQSVFTVESISEQ